MLEGLDFHPLYLTDIEIGEQIIWGGYSDVRRGWLTASSGSVEVAVKTLRLRHTQTSSNSTLQEDRLYRRFIRELFLWRDLRHPNVVPLLGLLHNPQTFPSLIAPWYANGCLTHFLASQPHPNRPSLALDVATGLEYLHSIHVVHGDLKPDNVLVDSEGRASLCDFGMSQFMGAALAVPGYTTTEGVGGTCRFLCPELLNDEPKTIATDTWAFACLTAHILTGQIPYSNIRMDAAVYIAILHGKPPMTFPYGDKSGRLWNCLTRCWNKSPEARPTTSVIRAHIKLIEQSAMREMLKKLAPSRDMTYRDIVTGVSFSPNGQYFAVSPLNGPVDLFTINGSNLVLDKVMWHEDFFCRGVQWAPTGRRLLAHSWHHIAIWAPETGALLWSAVREEKIQAITWLPSGSSIAIAEGSLVTILALDGHVSLRHNFSSMVVVAISFTPNHKRMILAAKPSISMSNSSSQKIILYNMCSGREEHRVSTLQDLRGIEVDEEGRHLLVSYYSSGMPQLWRIDETAASAKLTLLQAYQVAKSPRFADRAHFGGVRKQLVACTSTDGNIHIWDKHTADLLISIPAATYYQRLGGGESISFSWNICKDRFMFATSDCARGVQVWSSLDISEILRELSQEQGKNPPVFEVDQTWEDDAMEATKADNGILCVPQPDFRQICCDSWSQVCRFYYTAASDFQSLGDQDTTPSIGRRALHGIHVLGHQVTRMRNAQLPSVQATA